MQTLRFEDRDWFEREFVRDDNGRIVPRDEYEVRVEFREALRRYNNPENHTKFWSILQTALLGGIIWGAALILG